MSKLDLLETGQVRAMLQLNQFFGSGRINPRMEFHFNVRPAKNLKLRLDDVTLRLEYQNELIGEGRVVGIDVRGEHTTVRFEVVTSHRLLRYITDGFTSAVVHLQLQASLSGVASFTVETNDPSGPQSPQMVDDPEPGKWKVFAVTSSGSPLQLTCSEWYDNVLQPIRNEEFRYLEIALPRGDSALAVEWKSAVDHLVAAEKAYALGDDPAVFGYLRAAIDSLPSAPQHIFDSIKDEKKRKALDDLLKQAGTFLHVGRHVSKNGQDTDGTFPVDHLDAAFALDLSRVLLSHFSLLLSAERMRTSN